MDHKSLKIDGVGGNDAIKGKEGDDTLVGGKGNDHLAGDQGKNVLIGGPGSDRFFFQLSTLGHSQITNWDHGKTRDQIVLDKGLYKQYQLKKDGSKTKLLFNNKVFAEIESQTLTQVILLTSILTTFNSQNLLLVPLQLILSA